MATKETDSRPVCQFGARCYRKNPQHLKQFQHPKAQSSKKAEGEPLKKKAKPAETSKKGGTLDEAKPAETSKKGGTLDEFFGKKDQTKAESDEKPDEVEPESETEESEEEEETPPASPGDIKENIKLKYLSEMPQDFYDFWDFCKSKSPKKPEGALSKTVGLTLVGPFDILSGKHQGVAVNKHGRRPNFLLHWRYYYDPPEFTTIVKGDDSTQFHLGYFRDDPKEMPAFVGANSAKDGGSIKQRGDNLFAAVKFVIEERLKSRETDDDTKSKLKTILEDLTVWAKKGDHCLDIPSKKLKDRNKKKVCDTLHGAGLVVPVDENEVGYREVPETPGDLKKMLKKIVESKSETERDQNFEPLQELITLCQFANDECDYGEGLELGMDLFSYGGKEFHSTILHLLPVAYQLLHRNECIKIIKAHIKCRRKGADLSELD